LSVPLVQRLGGLFVLVQGYKVLRNGGEALDAVAAAVTIMEGNIYWKYYLANLNDEAHL